MYMRRDKMKENEIFKPMVEAVESDKNPDKKYFVTNYRPNRWTCTCPDYVYRSHNEEGYSTGHRCKHIKRLRDLRRRLEQND